MNQKFLTGQAVILAAGESSRFWPLNKKHKSLFKLMGKPLICCVLENLKKAEIKEVIIVQGPKKDIEEELKKCSLPKFARGIKYVVQKIPRGTGDALKCAEKYLKERFLVLYGDDFYGAGDLKNCLKKFPSTLVKEVKNPAHFGVMVVEKNYIKGIVEKPQRPPSNLVNAGGYFIPRTMLSEKIEKSQRGEYEITDYFNKLAKKIKVYFSKAKEWLPLSFSWDLLDISEFLLKNIKTEIRGKVEKNCYIKGEVFVGRGTIIKSGTYIEGPVYIGENCEIGPNCFLRPFTSVENNCRIGQSVEIKNSIISAGSKIAHLSYVADSIAGENCILGGGVVIANLRFDGKNVHSVVKGRLVDTGRRKFGAILGQGVKVGVNSSIMPGILIGKNSVIGPHSLARENIDDNKIFYTKFQEVIK
jgi:bifunctional UDP-N-acetylglucosamine pyrophosphorylase/glucosamine-1-phosphate N-acetyltransferase